MPPQALVIVFPSPAPPTFEWSLCASVSSLGATEPGTHVPGHVPVCGPVQQSFPAGQGTWAATHRSFESCSLSVSTLRVIEQPWLISQRMPSPLPPAIVFLVNVPLSVNESNHIPTPL